MLQFGHSSVAVHCRQTTAVANPRRFSRISDLLAALEPLLHRRDEGAAQHHVITRLCHFLAHVDHGHARHRPLEHTRLHLHQRVAALERVGVGLDRRRRRSDHHQRIRELASHDRHVAAVIPRRLVLLVRGVVLLIDDDQAGRGERRKYRGPRADHDVDIAPPDAVPLIVSFAVRQPAVLNGNRRPEARAKERRHLRRQRDFRNEHQHAASALPDGVSEPQVDLGLAAAGHAVDERYMERLRGGQRQQRLERALLIGRRVTKHRRLDRGDRVLERIAIDPLLANRDQAERLEARQRRVRDAALRQDGRSQSVGGALEQMKDLDLPLYRVAAARRLPRCARRGARRHPSLRPSAPRRGWS